MELCREKPFLLLGGMRYVFESAAPGVTALRVAVVDGRLTDSKDGLGGIADRAVAARTATLTAIAFLGVRRAPALAQLMVGNVMADRRPALCMRKW